MKNVILSLKQLLETLGGPKSKEKNIVPVIDQITEQISNKESGQKTIVPKQTVVLTEEDETKNGVPLETLNSFENVKDLIVQVDGYTLERIDDPESVRWCYENDEKECEYQVDWDSEAEQFIFDCRSYGGPVVPGEYKVKISETEKVDNGTFIVNFTVTPDQESESEFIITMDKTFDEILEAATSEDKRIIGLINNVVELSLANYSSNSLDFMSVPSLTIDSGIFYGGIQEGIGVWKNPETQEISYEIFGGEGNLPDTSLTITQNFESNNGVVDHTWQEIYDAYTSGKNVICNLDSNGTLAVTPPIGFSQYESVSAIGYSITENITPTYWVRIGPTNADLFETNSADGYPQKDYF